MNPDQAREFLNRRHQRPGDVFKDIMRRDGLVVALGVTSALDALAARQAKADLEAKGGGCTFQSIYAGGWSKAASLGYPDMGFLTRQVMADHATNVVRAAFPMPVMADAETGYGDPKAVWQTVRDYHHAGVAVLHLEDQDDNRACGHAGGRAIVPESTMAAKLRSMRLELQALDSSMLLLARTDAVGAENGDSGDARPTVAIERGKCYMDAEVDGVRCIDMLWAEFKTPNPDVINAWVHAMRQHDSSLPLAINYSPNKEWAQWYQDFRPGELPPSYADLREVGYSFIFHTIPCARMVMEAVYDGARDFGQHGAQALHLMQRRQRGTWAGKPQSAVGMGQWQEYGVLVGGDEAAERLARSGGFGGHR